MKFKAGVSQEGLRTEILDVLPAIEGLFLEVGYELTITCTTGSHPHEDPHPFGFAVDCRIHGLRPAVQQSLRKCIQAKVGESYTVLLESPGTPKEHIHIQYRKDLWRAIVRSEGHQEIEER